LLHNWLHYLWAKKTEPTEQDVRQNSDLVWMLWRDKNLLTLLETKTQHLGYPASSLISVPTGLSQMLDG
jgi:hypothetical protein